MIPNTTQALAASYDPYAPQALENPYPYYAALRSVAPCLFIEKYQVYFVSRYRDAEAVLRNWQTFSSYRGTGLVRVPTPSEGGVLVSNDPPEHTRIRRTVARDFTPHTITHLEGRVRALTTSLIDTMLEARTVDIISQLAEPLSVTIMAELLGLPEHHREDYPRWSDALFDVMGPPREDSTSFLQVAHELLGYMSEMAVKGDYAPGGLADALFKSVGTADISAEEAGSIVGSLLVAGMDTTISLIENAIAALIENPDQWEKLHANPELAASAVEETPRFDSPIQPGQFRNTTQETEIAGMPIPVDSRIMVGFASANRDPEQFSDADRFLIERKPNNHLAFGAGVHFCLGSPLVRLEAGVVLEQLARRVRSLSFAAPPKRKRNSMVRGFQELHVLLQPA